MTHSRLLLPLRRQHAVEHDLPYAHSYRTHRLIVEEFVDARECDANVAHRARLVRPVLLDNLEGYGRITVAYSTPTVPSAISGDG